MKFFHSIRSLNHCVAMTHILWKVINEHCRCFLIVSIYLLCLCVSGGGRVLGVDKAFNLNTLIPNPCLSYAISLYSVYRQIIYAQLLVGVSRIFSYIVHPWYIQETTNLTSSHNFDCRLDHLQSGFTRNSTQHTGFWFKIIKYLLKQLFKITSSVKCHIVSVFFTMLNWYSITS